MSALLTVAQVAERLNCSESFVYGLLAGGELRHFVLGRGE
jgi:excisionase family DNA binding protein